MTRLTFSDVNGSSIRNSAAVETRQFAHALSRSIAEKIELVGNSGLNSGKPWMLMQFAEITPFREILDVPRQELNVRSIRQDQRHTHTNRSTLPVENEIATEAEF